MGGSAPLESNKDTGGGGGGGGGGGSGDKANDKKKFIDGVSWLRIGPKKNPNEKEGSSTPRGGSSSDSTGQVEGGHVVDSLTSDWGEGGGASYYASSARCAGDPMWFLCDYDSVENIIFPVLQNRHRRSVCAILTENVFLLLVVHGANVPT